MDQKDDAHHARAKEKGLGRRKVKDLLNAGVRRNETKSLKVLTVFSRGLKGERRDFPCDRLRILGSIGKSGVTPHGGSGPRGVGRAPKEKHRA